MNTEHEIAMVRRQLGQRRTLGGRRSYTAAAKSAAVALLRARQREGHSLASTARLLDLHPVVLGSWLRIEPDVPRAPFAPVVLVESTPTYSTAAPVLLHTASGIRVEGLSVAQIADILRGLR